MNLGRFRAEAARMFEEIPEAFRAGVVELVVETGAPEHPGLPGIWTMGECITEEWPDGTGGLADTQSRIVLYHGSFRNIARDDPAFDWDAELWETIVHELLHHREAAAAESGLDAFDWAVDQNFLRHAGEPFDPDFYLEVPADADGAVRLDGETFLEAHPDSAATSVEFRWRDHRYAMGIPPDVDRAFVRVRNLAGGRLWVVVRRRTSWWRRLLASTDPGRIVTLERRALPAPGSHDDRR